MRTRYYRYKAENLINVKNIVTVHDFYFDKNFTVVGNLCFVHIPLDGFETIFDIPPAISDRILFADIVCDYTYYASNISRGIIQPMPNTGFAKITDGKIICVDVVDGFLFGYLSFFFPIDSNK